MHDYTRQENENNVPYLLVANKVKYVTDIVAIVSINSFLRELY